ncbi:MAG: high-potential iron-sulfur protein [bacterium]
MKLAKNRRQFIKHSTLIALTPALSYATQTQAEEVLIDEADPAAAALGYKHDAAEVDVARFPKKAGPEGAKQLCLNCSLYQPKTDELGGCQIFPGKNVAAGGWCNVWAPMA